MNKPRRSLDFHIVASGVLFNVTFVSDVAEQHSHFSHAYDESTNANLVALLANMKHKHSRRLTILLAVLLSKIQNTVLFLPFKATPRSNLVKRPTLLIHSHSLHLSRHGQNSRPSGDHLQKRQSNWHSTFVSPLAPASHTDILKSKTLLGVFNEAKTAYQDKKAGFKTARDEAQAKKAAASRPPSPPQPTMPIRRSYTEGYNNADPAYYNDGYHDANYNSQNDPRYRAYNQDNYDDELPPPLPARPDELRTKMTTLQRLLEESHCVASSAKTIVKSLESDPEKMAAVALSLAEIAALVKKAGITPAVLGTLGKAFPAVVALLISSEFLIAIGVGAGITVVALGGYKVVKRIQAKRVEQKEEKARMGVQGVSPIEMRDMEVADEEVEVDVDSIHAWRRGISEEDARSLASGVEGELVTPGASSAWLLEQQQEMRRLELQQQQHEKLRLDLQQQQQQNLRPEQPQQQQEPLRLEARSRQEEFLFPPRSNTAGPALEKERVKSSRSPFEKLFSKRKPE